MEHKLPPLPEPKWDRVYADDPYTTDGCRFADAYSDEQMLQYARTAIAAAVLREREECAAYIDRLIKDTGNVFAAAIRARGEA